MVIHITAKINSILKQAMHAFENQVSPHLPSPQPPLVVSKLRENGGSGPLWSSLIATGHMYVKSPSNFASPK